MSVEIENAQWFANVFERITQNVGRALLGKEDVIRLALTCMFSEGHLLLEDAPGTGKTALARAVAATVAGTNSRIQFTPDLLPSDITGTNIYNQRHRHMGLSQGSYLCLHRAGRRDQPCITQDAVRTPGSHGRIACHD